MLWNFKTNWLELDLESDGQTFFCFFIFLHWTWLQPKPPSWRWIPHSSLFLYLKGLMQAFYISFRYKSLKTMCILYAAYKYATYKCAERCQVGNIPQFCIRKHYQLNCILDTAFTWMSFRMVLLWDISKIILKAVTLNSNIWQLHRSLPKSFANFSQTLFTFH